MSVDRSDLITFSVRQWSADTVDYWPEVKRWDVPRREAPKVWRKIARQWAGRDDTRVLATRRPMLLLGHEPHGGYSRSVRDISMFAGRDRWTGQHAYQNAARHVAVLLDDHAQGRSRSRYDWRVKRVRARLDEARQLREAMTHAGGMKRLAWAERQISKA